MTTEALHRKLRQIVRRGRVLTARAQLAGYDADGLGYKTFPPDAVVIPADAAELAALMRQAKSLGVPVTLRGAGTSLSGGPVAAQGGVIAHTSALRAVRQVSPAGFWCEVECGVPLNRLDEVLAPTGLFYPPDPSSGPVCTLGGNVAMNAGGAHCFRHGVTSHYVLGVEAVTLDGEVCRFGGPAGGRGAWRDDWKRLMVGSEGTLAAFTRFWLRLLPRPEKCWTYRATFPDLRSAERAVQALALDSSFPVAIELMDPRCVAMVENSPMAVGLPKDSFLIVTEIDGPAELADTRAPAVAEILRAAGATGVESSDDEATRKGLWKARKVAGGLMGQISPDFLVQDAVIPRSALADILQLVYDEADAAGLPAVNVFHAGDGNLHPNFLFDSKKPGDVHKVEEISKRLMKRVIDAGGTLSGEHGIGNDKTCCMPMVFSGAALRLQLAIPKIFNAEHRLNPLKVFASRRFGGGGEEPAAPPPDPRLFSRYFDAVDGTACVPAGITPAELAGLAAPARFRFPLLVDDFAPLSAQVASTTHAPASSRFGALCDNIIGMNWRLPTGETIRAGERVAKSTTGYDLLRFLLHSPGDYGEPADFVIRLRPHTGLDGHFLLRGPESAVASACAGLESSCWVDWFDSLDYLPGPDGLATLRAAVNCPPAEWPVFERRVASLADRFGLGLEARRGEAAPRAGCPDISFKTTPDRAFALAGAVAREPGARAMAIAFCGVVHAWLDAPSESGAALAAGIIARHHADAGDLGADWTSRLVPRPPARGAEAPWRAQLAAEFSR
ncbi:MAG: FAD-binding protein [Planctomycetes bacterium]|nr:FAD-binding protein [Planctomycetota bacterium]